MIGYEKSLGQQGVQAYNNIFHSRVQCTPSLGLKKPKRAANVSCDKFINSNYRISFVKMEDLCISTTLIDPDLLALSSSLQANPPHKYN